MHTKSFFARTQHLHANYFESDFVFERVPTLIFKILSFFAKNFFKIIIFDQNFVYKSLRFAKQFNEPSGDNEQLAVEDRELLVKATVDKKYKKTNGTKNSFFSEN